MCYYYINLSIAFYSCGDDTFEGPVPRGDGQCENMNLLLGKNKQRV